MHSLKPEIKKDIQCIIDSLAKRDTSKYMIYYNDKPICIHPLNNAQTVWCMAELWVKLQQRTVSLEELKEDKKNPPRLYGSGMLVINAPWKLKETTQGFIDFVQSRII